MASGALSIWLAAHLFLTIPGITAPFSTTQNDFQSSATAGPLHGQLLPAEQLADRIRSGVARAPFRHARVARSLRLALAQLLWWGVGSGAANSVHSTCQSKRHRPNRTLAGYLVLDFQDGHGSCRGQQSTSERTESSSPFDHRNVGHGDRRQGPNNSWSYSTSTILRSRAGEARRRHRRQPDQGNRGSRTSSRHGKTCSSRVHSQQAWKANSSGVREDEAAR